MIASGVDYIACEGFCKEFFHAACVKLSHEDIMRHRNTKSNFCWLCNQCIRNIHKQGNDSSNPMSDQLLLSANETSPKATDITRIDGEIVKLKEEIFLLHHSLAQSNASRVEAKKT